MSYTHDRDISLPSLAALRKQRGWTQSQLSKKSGYHRATIAQIETGTKKAGRAAMEAFSKALGCSIADLLAIPEAC